MDEEIREALLARRPRLHDFADGAGGLEDAAIRAMLKCALALKAERKAINIIETGAGLSTLLFLTLEPAELVTIAPAPLLRDRIFSTALEYDIDTSPLRFIAEPSQDALPALGTGTRFDIGLIDGLHSYPVVFIDYFYINRILNAGGLLVVDDLQMGSGRELFQFMKAQPSFCIEELKWKTAIFRKTAAVDVQPEMCAYNELMSYCR